MLLAAADTFRAAAREQLSVWADRTAVDIISQDGGDPAAVAFDAVSAGKARGKDVVLVDTAGRLAHAVAPDGRAEKDQTRDSKSRRRPAPHEVLLVIDGNTGQNALTQVKAFDDALGLTGLIVTKLDGTAKGGVLAAIARERPSAARCRCTSSAWAKSWKTWKPSTPANSPRRCWPDGLIGPLALKIAPITSSCDV